MSIKSIKKIPAFAVLLISSIALFSQNQNIVFKYITHKDGLDENEYITALLQDQNGFVWIAKTNAVQRYDGYEFKDYILNEVVYNITEDRRGMIWVSTLNGTYVINPENDKIQRYAHHATQNRINKILEDKNGIIWCAAQNGLLKMVPKFDNGERLLETIFNAGVDSAFNISVINPYEVDSGGFATAIYEIYEDSRGQLWIGTSMGLLILSKETGEFFRIDDNINGQTRLNDQNVIKVAEESPEILWVQTTWGFNRISNIIRDISGGVIDKADLEIINYRDDRLAVGAGYYSNNRLLISNKNNFWVGSAYGLIKMSIDNIHQVEFEGVYEDLYEPEGVEYHEVISLMEDRTGLIWVGHRSPAIKIFREERNPVTPMEGMLAEYEEAVYDFNQVYKDDNESLWICTWGSGLFKISPEGIVDNYMISNVDLQDLVQANTMVSLLEMDDGSFRVGTNNGIVKFDTRTGIFTDIVPIPGTLIIDMIRIKDYVIAVSKNNGIAVYNEKTNEFEFYSPNQRGKAAYNVNTGELDIFQVTDYDNSRFLSSNIISSNHMKNDEIWITSSLGITRISLDETTGEINFLPLPEMIEAKYDTLFKDVKLINRIFEDRQGRLWFCTEDGLISLDLTSGEISKWTEKEGLYSNIVTSIQEDQNGNLWMGTSYGLSMLNPVTGEIKTYDDTDGLPIVRHTIYCSLIDDEGLIYFGGWGGFYCIDPANMFKNDKVPPVVITDFRLFNESVEVNSTRKAILTKNISYTQEIKLKYNQHDISFTFAALDYNDPAKNKYAYMLEGYQDEWVETDADNRIATYTNLNPGEYRFRVKGSNNDGVWNKEGAFIRVIIRPPFWKTTLAYIAYGIIFLLLLRGYIYWRIRRLRKEKTELEKQVSERTSQIEKQKEDLKTANIQLKEHERELETANTKLKKNQEELQEVNTLLEEQKEELNEINALLEEQKEELMQQKEELQSTLENLQKTQEQLVESEKMAAVGGLVAGVAHEINTPVGIGITAISNLQDDIQRMARLYEKDQISRQDFRKFIQSSQEVSRLIQKNLERTASLVQSFKQVSTDQVTEQQRVFAFREYLNDILLSLRPKFSDKTVDFKIECDEELKLNSYPGVYAQIFTNLLLNSLQHGFYKKDSGIITIKARMDNELLKIQYKDNGEGISGKDLHHIFEPFYTSDQHRGTGLGLNIIYNLVKQKLHGTISCESEPGKGVLFNIEIPVK